MGLKIGVIGLGRMGAAMAARLVERGHEVSGWNRTASRAEAIEGLKAQPSPAAVVAASDYTIVMLFDEVAAKAVYHGEEGILSADVTSTIVIDMTTLKPGDMKANAEAVGARGGRFVACPVGGTVGPARSGTLLGLAGGDAAAIEAAKPALDELCDRMELFETPEAASAIKLAVNLPLLAAFQALGEAALLTRDFGITPERLVGIIGKSSGGAPAIGRRGPVIVSEMMGQGGAVPGFSIEAVEKDLRLMDELGEADGFNLPVVESVRRMAHDAVREGWGDRDLAALSAFNLRA